MLEMLPAPIGSGAVVVAPDHPEDQTISAQFEKTANHERFPVLRQHQRRRACLAGRAKPSDFDARRLRHRRRSPTGLNIPGRGSAGQRAGGRLRRLVQRPPALRRHVTRPDGCAANGGGANGNVALDVARVLVSDPKPLSETDICRPRAGLRCNGQGCRGGCWDGRRGLLQATFTTLELRELCTTSRR